MLTSLGKTGPSQTPLFIMDLLLTARMPWPTIMWTVFMDRVMVVMGLIRRARQGPVTNSVSAFTSFRFIHARSPRSHISFAKDFQKSLTNEICGTNAAFELRLRIPQPCSTCSGTSAWRVRKHVQKKKKKKKKKNFGRRRAPRVLPALEVSGRCFLSLLLYPVA